MAASAKFRANIGLFYDSDAKAWAKYLVGILPPMESLNFGTHELRNVEDALPGIMKESTTVVILLSPAMLEHLEQSQHLLDPHFSKHQSIVVITCFTDPKDFAGYVQTLYSNSKTWKVLPLGNSREEYKSVVYNLVETVDSHLLKLKKQGKKISQKTKNCLVVPELIVKASQRMLISFEKEVLGTVQVGFKDDDKLYDTERRNPYTFTLRAPNHKPGPIEMRIFEDKQKISSVAITYSRLMLAAFECPVYLAQILGIPADDKEELDLCLVEHFQKSLPWDNMNHDVFKSCRIEREDNRRSEFLPTTLHFAAHYGLSELCMLLARSPGGCKAFDIENVHGDDAADLAEKSGHKELADFLRLFIETQEVVEACDDIYMEMNRLDENLYLNHSSDASEWSQAPPTVPPHTMPPAVPPHTRPPAVPPKPQSTRREPVPRLPVRDRLQSRASTESAAEFMGIAESSYKLIPSPGAGGSTTQQELIDIQNAFKEGKVSLSEVENLFANWKEQQINPSPSIKQRQENLEKLRKENAHLLKTAGTVSKRKKKPKLQSSTGVADAGPTETYANFTSRELQSLRISNLSTTSSSGSSSRGSCDSGGCFPDDSDEDDGTVQRRLPLLPTLKSNRQTLIGQLKEIQIERDHQPDPPKPPPRTPTPKTLQPGNKRARLPSPVNYT
ncbi:hypothetical protein ScPMuIL_004140 [Solemya velum]